MGLMFGWPELEMMTGEGSGCCYKVVAMSRSGWVMQRRSRECPKWPRMWRRAMWGLVVTGVAEEEGQWLEWAYGWLEDVLRPRGRVGRLAG